MGYNRMQGITPATKYMCLVTHVLSIPALHISSKEQLFSFSELYADHPLILLTFIATCSIWVVRSQTNSRFPQRS